MKILLTISRAIDAINERAGRALIWLVLAMVVVSAGNASARYLLNISSNGWLELQWYMYGAVFLLGAGYTLRHNEHVRIDVLSSRLSQRSQTWIDLFGTVFFLLPMSLFILWLSWPAFANAWITGEVSSNAGGLVRWPARLLVPAGFFLLSLQGFSELIKRVAFLRGSVPAPAERPGAAPVEPARPAEGEPR